MELSNEKKKPINPLTINLLEDVDSKHTSNKWVCYICISYYNKVKPMVITRIGHF
jgi:hypothetical protein